MSATVELRGVAKSFGPIDAVSSTDLTVAAGDVVTLLGPSGCGKTTLLRMIAGLIEPDHGTITVDDVSPAAARAAKQIGVVPQSPALLPWRSVRANASLLLDLRRSVSPKSPSEPVDALLDAVGLTDFAEAFPHELSGGMQQRVGLVRAFALDAPLLVMDEPFAALDEMTRTEMRHLLVRLRDASGATVIFVTHSVAEAAFLSDRVAVMTPRPGRIDTIVDIDLPRRRLPDIEDTSPFFETTKALRSALRHGSAS